MEPEDLARLNPEELGRFILRDRERIDAERKKKPMHVLRPVPPVRTGGRYLLRDRFIAQIAKQVSYCGATDIHYNAVQLAYLPCCDFTEQAVCEECRRIANVEENLANKK